MTRFAFSSAVYARHEGAILLVHHKIHKAWVPVGGEIEPGETPLQAAIRELYEETGMHPKSLPFLLEERSGAPSAFIGYEEHEAGPKGIHGTFSFLFDVWARDFELCAEHDDCLWHDGWASALAERFAVPPNVKHYLTVIRHTMRLERAREATR